MKFSSQVRSSCEIFLHLDVDGYVGSVEEIIKLVEIAKKAAPENTTCYTITITQTQNDKTTESSLCLIDVNHVSNVISYDVVFTMYKKDNDLLHEILRGTPLKDNVVHQMLMNEFKQQKFKTILLANCSPTIATAHQTLQTLQMVKTFHTIENVILKKQEHSSL